MTELYIRVCYLSFGKFHGHIQGQIGSDCGKKHEKVAFWGHLVAIATIVRVPDYLKTNWDMLAVLPGSNQVATFHCTLAL